MDICNIATTDGRVCSRPAGHSGHHHGQGSSWGDYTADPGPVLITCTFCGGTPKLYVSSPEEYGTARICIDCALQAIRILVAGAIEIAGKPKPPRPVIIKPGNE